MCGLLDGCWSVYYSVHSAIYLQWWLQENLWEILWGDYVIGRSALVEFLLVFLLVFVVASKHEESMTYVDFIPDFLLFLSQNLS